MQRYSSDELYAIFCDKNMAYDIIPHIKDNQINIKLWNEKYKSQWKSIQRQLSHGMLCPICGSIKFKFYRKHLAAHNIDLQCWYDEAYDILNRPRCPICGKFTEFVENKLFYRKFCSNAHQSMLIDVETGKSFGWIQEDIEKHNNIRSQRSRIAITEVNRKYGSEFATELTMEQRINRGLILDEDYKHWQIEQKIKKSLYGKLGGYKGFLACVKKYGLLKVISRGYKSVVILDENKQFRLESQQELFHLLKRIFIDKDQIDTMRNAILLENNTSLFFGRGAISDLVIDDGIHKINYEVHDINDIEAIKRKQLCSELNGYDFVLEDIMQYTYPNGKYIEELKTFIDVDDIYNRLSSENKNGKVFILDLRSQV